MSKKTLKTVQEWEIESMLESGLLEYGEQVYNKTEGKVTTARGVDGSKKENGILFPKK